MSLAGVDRSRTPSVATWQRGVFTRAQARADGFTDRQVRRRVETGAWQRVAGTALASAARPVGVRELGVAACLTWPDAVISHRLAGAIWELPGCETTVATVTVPPNQVRRGFRLRARRADVPLSDRTTLAGLTLTDAERTALDLLAAQPWDQARALWAWLVTRGHLDLRRLESGIERRKYLGGTLQLRRLLDVARTGSLSAAEDAFHELMRRVGIDGWMANVPITVGGRVVAVVDVLFPHARLVVEVDGWSTHGHRAAFQRDRARQNALVNAGYLVLRFTWEDLQERPTYVVQAVRGALAKIS